MDGEDPLKLLPPMISSESDPARTHPHVLDVLTLKLCPCATQIHFEDSQWSEHQSCVHGAMKRLSESLSFHIKVMKSIVVHDLLIHQQMPVARAVPLRPTPCSLTQ